MFRDTESTVSISTSTATTASESLSGSKPTLASASASASLSIETASGNPLRPDCTTITTPETVTSYNERLKSPGATVLPYQLTCSVITPSSPPSHTPSSDFDTYSQYSCQNPADSTLMTLLTMRRRRLFQRRACVISIVGAFILGLALGVFVPMFGLANFIPHLSSSPQNNFDLNVPPLPYQEISSQSQSSHLQQASQSSQSLSNHLKVNETSKLSEKRPISDFPTIYEMKEENQPKLNPGQQTPASVSFVKEESLELTAEEVFRNAFHLEQDKNNPDKMLVKKLDAQDGSIKEFRVQRMPSGRFLKGPERRLSKPSLTEQVLKTNSNSDSGSESDSDSSLQRSSLNFVPMAQKIAEQAKNSKSQDFIKNDIFWGDLVEAALPKGFSKHDALEWNRYVTQKGVVSRLESGCGRMQNRLVIFADGRKACARYRQNTDQIQGELFSFYLGQLLNLTNLAPSAAAVINLDSSTWINALSDITQAQWKQQRPVVLTQWLPDLEPAGIPQPFQPLERHLNKYDVWNITLAHSNQKLNHHHQLKPYEDDDQVGNSQKEAMQPNRQTDSLLQAHQSFSANNSTISTTASVTTRISKEMLNATLLQQLIELAQWSDLIVFDYLIANLDRVVNNLYNFQWNADIMAAPAHNLARQINSQLLVFLDNESGLLHGYRLLKKYEAYHSLLLDNLCVFRQPTIKALQQLRIYGPGRRLRELFEQTTNNEVRDVLPSLPDKSIKILIDRIDRVLGQVQKCRDLLADR